MILADGLLGKTSQFHAASGHPAIIIMVSGAQIQGVVNGQLIILHICLDLEVKPLPLPFTFFLGDLLEGWPVTVPHSSIHTKPLPYDVDGNGHLDIIIITSQGQIVALKSSGETLQAAQLNPLLVHKDWNERTIASGRQDIHHFILDDPVDAQHEAKNVNKKYLAIDPHVLADPVILDLNDDGIVEELVVVVSYYLDEDDYPLIDSIQGVSKDQWDRYLVSALLLFNLTTMQVYKTYHLELTTRHLVFPGYVFAAPLVVDLDADGNVDIIVGSATGRVHVMDINGEQKEGFPVIVDSVLTEISAVDVDNDGKLELIFADSSGTVHCIAANGEPVWETEHEGDSFSPVKVADVTDITPGIEVLLSADTGLLHVLQGSNGKPLPNWPQKVGSSVESSPLVMKLCRREENVVIVLAADGHLHLISGNADCKQTINLGEKSFVDLTVYQRENWQGIIVLTKDGTAMSLKESGKDCLSNSSSNPQVHIHLRNVSYVTGSEFSLHYSVTNVVGDYAVRVYIGKQLLYTDTITVDFHTEGLLTVPAPSKPMSGHLQVVLVDKHRQVLTDTKFVHFNTLWKEDVKLVFLFPVLMLSGLLLFGFGFQTAELLPFTQQAKDL